MTPFELVCLMATQIKTNTLPKHPKSGVKLSEGEHWSLSIHRATQGMSMCLANQVHIEKTLLDVMIQANPDSAAEASAEAAGLVLPGRSGLVSVGR